MKRTFLLLSVFILTLNLIGCLTVETKEYSFKLNKGNSGEGRIKYINIMRTIDSAGTTTIEADYDELVSSYLKGSMPENEMQGVKNVKKRLFEEDNQLCGEITFEFDDIKTLKFYNYKNLMWGYYLSSGTSMLGTPEQFFSSNGTYGEANMPVIFWDSDEKNFKFKTTMNDGKGKTESLLGIWKASNDK
jgi:hypothetical protein